MAMGGVVEANVFTRLNAEWQWVCAEDGNARQVRAWLVEAAVPGVAEAPYALDVLLDWLQERPLCEGRSFSDMWLGALLRFATGDGERGQLAARVAVQAMLPAAVRMAKRSVRAEERVDDVAQVVVVALTQAVHTYPVHRRPEQVARHLRLEMWHHTSRDLAREIGPSASELDVQVAAGPTAQVDPALRAEEAWLERAAAEAGLGEDLEGARGPL
ncbi:hypothetical protein [Streptomyces sp. NPDC055709]